MVDAGWMNVLPFQVIGNIEKSGMFILIVLTVDVGRWVLLTLSAIFKIKRRCLLLEINCFQDVTLRVPLLLLLLLLFCSHLFFGLNAFLISDIKPLLRTLVRKYAEGKGSVADSVSRSTTWGKGLLLPFLDSSRAHYRFCLKLKDFSTLNFDFEKLNSYFLLLNSHWE